MCKGPDVPLTLCHDLAMMPRVGDSSISWVTGAICIDVGRGGGGEQRGMAFVAHSCILPAAPADEHADVARFLTVWLAASTAC